MINMLAIDIGNTNITAGLFKGKELAGKVKIPSLSYYLYDKRLNGLIKGCGLKHDDINQVAISSVVPLALARIVVSVNKLMRHKCAILIVGKDAEAPIKNMYTVKKEVGQDRLVNAFAAKAMYGHPAVIIDFGTAITFDVVSKEGDYLGGLILPGIEMGLKSLHKCTALLPKVELGPAKHIIGTDTESSMQGGILFGYGAMCDGLVKKYRELLGKELKVIATGGNAGLIKKYSESIEIVDEDLTLTGLNLIGLSNS